ncbi:MAG: hypothetical protein NT137_08545 [Methanomassiliicoccales archaeon]|nr:hypothetical protein [Methanomassiliicoccales archaeon]
MDDIRLEKCLEAIYEQVSAPLPPECRKDCPMLRVIADLLVGVKSVNNEEVAIEMGILQNGEWKCPTLGE